MNKQAVFDGYSFSNAKGEFMVYRDQWWKVWSVVGGGGLAAETPKDEDLLWLNTFTTICPMPERPMVPVQ